MIAGGHGIIIAGDIRYKNVATIKEDKVGKVNYLQLGTSHGSSVVALIGRDASLINNAALISKGHRAPVSSVFQFLTVPTAQALWR